MAKKGKHLPAAQKLKISEGVKRAQAARLEKLAKPNGPVPAVEFTYAPGTPRSSSEAARLAADLVDLIGDEMPAQALVTMVERILRP